MSFKYRFILSFVVLEIFFILLIIFINFSAINNSSKRLNEEKINSNITFMKELLSVPISIYDLATLDNIIEKTQKLGYINSIIILDSNKKLLSKIYKFNYEPLEDFLNSKTDRSFEFKDETYEIRYIELSENKTKLGSIYFVFDTSENSKFIQETQHKTILIVLLEILLSTFLSFIIGSRLTNMLTNLSYIAKKIGKDKIIKVPYQNKQDEIGILAKSMDSMQTSLKLRNDKLKKSAKILEEQKKDLIKANKTKDMFLANISHEIRTPLNGIIGFTDLLIRSELNEKQQKYINIISKSANNLLEIINDILDFSKIQSGKFQIVEEKASLHKLIEDIKDLYEAKSNEKNLNIHLKKDEDIPAYLLFDKLRLQQVLSNLLSNAIKFSKNGGDIWLNIKLINIIDEKAKVYFEVKDNGVGISKKKQKEVFMPFSQADSSVTKKYGGTGLGLTILSKILEQMDSKINLDSQEDFGSKFYFEIDFKIIREVEKKAIEKQDFGILKLHGDILVAEDNSINQQLLKVLLEEYSLNIDFANNGQEAIEKFRNKKYDLILMDINMPICDGITATKTIRDIEKNHPPIIALTANAMKQDIDKYLEIGMDTYIPKPLNAKVLIDVLKKYLK